MDIWGHKLVERIPSLAEVTYGWQGPVVHDLCPQVNNAVVAQALRLKNEDEMIWGTRSPLLFCFRFVILTSNIYVYGRGKNVCLLLAPSYGMKNDLYIVELASECNDISVLEV